jgi:hypothetical protein
MSHSRPARQARAYRPRLEVLEDRTLPSTYLVDHLPDDMVGTGLTGSLRYALTHAADNDHVTFGVTGTINLTGALPTLTHSISIEGPGATQLTVRRDTGGSYGIFAVGSGATVSISGLSITNGLTAYGVDGGGISNGGTLTVSDSIISGNTAGGSGGGIANGGTLTLSNSTVVGNDAQVQIGSTIGGGILNIGTLILSNSTVSGNHVVGYGGGIYNLYGDMTVSYSTISGNTASPAFEGGGSGGGIYNYQFGLLTLSNSTVSGNHAQAGEGGGLLNDSGASMEITNSTISNNTAGLGGGISNSVEATVLNMRNTILARNSGFSGPSDLYGSLSSSGHNLIGNTQGSSGFDPTDLLNVNPLLGPLQDNGGPTQTMALLAGSPALNAGDTAQLGVADQRGVVRSGGVNIGAYQASASALVLTAPATMTAGVPFDLTVKAVDPLGQVARGYTGTVTFSSTDPNPAAVLPAAYPFTLGDAGQHTFTGGVTLLTAGSQTVTATDSVTGSITGSASASVNPAAADHLLFLQQPTDTAAGQTISPVIVEVVDAFGNVETGDNSDTITLSIGANPSGGTLSGTLTVTVVNGVATFSDLSLDLTGAGYTLHATVGGGLPDIDSNPFNVTT